MKNHVLGVLLLSICSISNSQTLSDSSRAKLHVFLDSVQTADVYQYDTKDNLDQSMDCAKIIANPNGGFIAVYHHYSSSQPQVFLATEIFIRHLNLKQLTSVLLMAQTDP